MPPSTHHALPAFLPPTTLPVHRASSCSTTPRPTHPAYCAAAPLDPQPGSPAPIAPPAPTLAPASDPAARRRDAFEVRVAAATLARARTLPVHRANGDEQRYRRPGSTVDATHIASFTKGLPHDRDTAILSSPAHFAAFVRAIATRREADIRAIPLGPIPALPRSNRFTSALASNPEADTRAWESLAAGSTFDLQAPDAQAVSMPPAPSFDSDRLVAEVTELYWMALLRDIPFAAFPYHPSVATAVSHMNHTAWVRAASAPPPTLSLPEKRQLRGPFTAHTFARGTLPGDAIGPYISQFLLAGTPGLGAAGGPEDGYINYGANRIDQRVRVAQPYRDYMTTWESFLDVQNGADVRGRELYTSAPDPLYRFMATPRDLAAYVHYDALYQANLNACILLLGLSAPFDKGLPYTADDDTDKQQGFVTFGGPHVLTLVTEVATRALKAVRFQKYNVHRRCRPEAVGGLLERFHHDPGNPIFAGVKPLYEALSKELLSAVAAHNGVQNKLSDNGAPRSQDYSPTGVCSETMLLPMAFAEGSPMHPSYGAGHAAVAGACATILKAFFDHEWELPFAFAASEDGSKLEAVDGVKLTVGGELNKLCSNISIGRNWAGVHYFSDYVESVRLGEEIAIGLLEEQRVTYDETFTMTIPLFDGSVHYM